jgi:hypothetical protein
MGTLTTRPQRRSPHMLYLPKYTITRILIKQNGIGRTFKLFERSEKWMQHFNQKTCREYLYCVHMQPVVYSILYFKITVLSVNTTNSLPYYREENSGCLFKLCACLVNVYASTALTALWLQHSWMKPRFHYLLLVQCVWEINCHLCGVALK